jgi:hypothetical protein
MPDQISTEAEEMLDLLPPFLATAIDAQAILDVLAREIKRIDEAKENLRDNFYPQRGEDYLKVWEDLLGLTVEPLDKTLNQRRNSIAAFLAGLKAGGSGDAWEESLTRLIGTGWSYEEHDPDDGGSPDPYVVKVTIPFGSPLDAPENVAATGSNTGGTLAAGTYHYAVTAINSYGETTASTIDTATTSGSTGSVTVDWDVVDGATGYRVYRGTSAGTLRLVTTILNSATDTYLDDGDATTMAAPPTVNTTSSPQAYEAKRLARQITPAHIELIFAYGEGFILGISRLGEEPV